MQSILLEAGTTPAGYGDFNSEIFVVKNHDHGTSRALTTKLLNTHTSSVIIADDSHTGPLHDAIEWVGSRMKHYTASFPFSGAESFDRDFIANLAQHCRTKKDNPALKRHGKVIREDVQSNVNLLSAVFNLSSGFNLDFVKLNLEEPIWHVDYSVQTIPIDRFAKAVRCAHEQGSWIALKQDTKTRRTVDNDGRASVSYTVDQFAEAGSGLYILRGDSVHSSPVPKDGKPRTVYTITPHQLLDRSILQNR